MTNLGAIDPSSGTEANGVAECVEENEDNACIICGVVDVVRVSLWQGTIDLEG
jgi:hypothetical protein